MISKTAKTKSIILDLLSDGMEHTSDEMRSRLREEGIEVDKQSSTLKMAIYQLRVNGSEIYSRVRGVYQLKEEKKQAMLAEFITLMPEEKNTSYYTYIHTDGNIVLNGKLNREIDSRQIEIKITNDGVKIALIPNGEKNHRFTKSGKTKNMELLKRLKSNHISVPTAYEMKLDKKTGVWIGTVNKNNVKKGKQITKK
ncbi:hypothetical protein GPK90_03740 [Clostridium sp. MCC344]|nr:hypothetical protein [Clostridium sp. MCC344]MBT9788474.1 hypothetical protein [Clostridium sp. MCC344]